MAGKLKPSDLDINQTSETSDGELISSLVSNLEKECSIKRENSTNNEPNDFDNGLTSTDFSNANIENKDIGQSGDDGKVFGTGNKNEKVEDDSIENDQIIPSPEDDLVDELAMKDLELTLSEEDRQKLHKQAEVYKQNGNDLFKTGEFRESALAYTRALRTCPLAFTKDRAIFYSNRAAAKMKLEMNESAIEDCTKALELEESYLKALFRRAQLYETTEKLDESLEDYKKILEIDPLHRDALYASKRLPDQIQERNEKLKTEMLGKLKDLGNMVLRPFGLSTENFQMTQDPNSGGYSINFKS